MMDRRAFLSSAAVAILSASLTAGAQPGAKVPRIGVIVPVEPASPTEPNLAAFRQGLRDLGYVDGQTVTVDYRYAHGKIKLYAALAAELVRLQVDVIVVGHPAATLAAKNETKTIPIVGVGMGADPVRDGLVTSLARPGGNVTGSAWLTGEEFVAKWVELLKKVAPETDRIGYMRDARDPVSAQYAKGVETASQGRGLKFRDFGLREITEVADVFAALSKERGGALIVGGALLFTPHASQISDLAVKHRLPAIYSMRVFMDAGGLMSYGPSLVDLWRRAAIYVDKILKGAKPADLPVERPTKFELVVNLKTAKALGLTIPPSLLLRADEVIQ